MENNILNISLQISSAIGSLSTFGAFIFLFRRDKDKQAQIDKLSGIATILESQNETMKMQNDLIAQQVNILRNTALLKLEDNVAIKGLREIEERKLKLTFKPNLWINGGGYNSEGKLHIDLNNKGENAHIQNLILVSGDIAFEGQQFPYVLEKSHNIQIRAKSLGVKHIKDCDYEIDLIYSDNLENRYMSKIKGKGAKIATFETHEIE